LEQVMTNQAITIALPEPIVRQLTRMAEATQQSIETLITQSILSNLPPSAENAPSDLQTELLQMQTFEIEKLLEIAQAETEPSQYLRHEALLAKKQTENLTAVEQQDLAMLRQTADQLMVRKAYAWSVLRWRGYRLPALHDLAVPL
jgi:hypothetical protein